MLIFELLFLFANVLAERLYHALFRLNLFLSINDLRFKGDNLSLEILLLLLAFYIGANNATLSDLLPDLALEYMFFVLPVSRCRCAAIIVKNALELQIVKVIEHEFVWRAEFFGSAVAGALYRLELTDTILAI